MTIVHTGDMARSYLFTRQNSTLKTEAAKLSLEMASGQKADLARATSGDLMTLAALNHRIGLLASHKTATAEADLFTETVQTALETSQSLIGDLAPALADAGVTSNPTQMRAVAFDARQRLFTAVSALNAQTGDRYVLSGAGTDGAPLAGAQEILNGLSAAIAGQPTASDALGAIDAWFDAPAGGGGFADQIYGGSAAPLAPFAIEADARAQLTTTAMDPAIRDTLKGLAVAALVADGAFAGNPSAQSLLLKGAGETLFAANDGLAELRGQIGSVQGRIASAETRNSAESSTLQIARAGIVGADPYETASALEATQTQLETLYSLTARLSRLSLADFLR